MSNLDPGPDPQPGDVVVPNTISNLGPTFPTVRASNILGGLQTVDTIADRNAILTPFRNEGMIVYVCDTGDTFQLQGGVANSNWVLFMGSAGPQALQRQSYGSVQLVREGANVNFINVEGDAVVGNVDTVTSLDDHYALSRRDLLINGTRTPVPETIQTAADLNTFVASVMPQDASGNATATVYMETYDLVDPLLPTPYKVYGRNGAYARLRARNVTYKGKSQGNALVLGDNVWPILDQLLLDVWSDLIGTPPAVVDDGFRALFWPAPGYRKLYDGGSLQGNHRVYAQSGSITRQVSPLAADPPAPQPMTDDHFYTGDSVLVSIDARTGQPLNVNSGYVNPWGTIENKIQKNLLDYASFLIFGRCVDITSTTQGVFVKPMGVDTFTLPFHDDSVIRPEVVGTSNRDTQSRVRVLPPGSRPASTRFDAAGNYYLGDILPAAPIGRSGTSRGSFGPGEIRFRWRRLADNVVSPPANAMLVFNRLRPNGPLVPIVRNRVGA